MTALQVLEQVADIIRSRGTQRDLADGERSMARCVGAFNHLTKRDMTETEGWIFMLLLKVSRSSEGSLCEDDFLDMVGYAALAAERILEGEEGAVQKE